MLYTPRGEAIWKWGNLELVIDLIFVYEDLAGRILFCGPEEKWAIT